MMKGPKTYGNSYLYNRIPDYERNILEFIMKAERIDKSSEAFLPIVEDVKRRQTSAVLSRVLARDDVVLVTYTKPLPTAFKVFACKDVKIDQSPKVFIDCSGLINSKNGFLYCTKIDILCTYLLDAMTYLIYTNDYTRILTNSTIIHSSTENFVTLATHVFDYLRPNGFAENRNKIGYILAMYFQVGVIGLDRDTASVKNLAAKISDIKPTDINAMEIYYHDEDLLTIDTIITSLTNTFKLTGMSTAAFVEKWMWLYGAGTQFGTELFPAFSAIITDTYCGSYVNNQKTIEKCCGRGIVNYTNAILRLGTDVINSGYKYESTMDREYNNRSISDTLDRVQRSQVNESVKFTVRDYSNFDTLKTKVNLLAKYPVSKSVTRQRLMEAYYGGVGYVADCMNEGRPGADNVISFVVETVLPYADTTVKNTIRESLNMNIIGLRKALVESKDFHNITSIMEDFKKALSMVDETEQRISSNQSEADNKAQMLGGIAANNLNFNSDASQAELKKNQSSTASNPPDKEV